ncbi:MAG: protein kinase, partial [Myxococcales bacterium]|nr:protein kinase [Myxococcales bacterium]
MNRRTFPNGQATASKLKALVLHLERAEGAAAADAWLASLKIERGDIEDETRLLPLATLKAALASFEGRFGRAAIGDSAPMLVAQENLGAWMKLVRGTQSPEDLFARLDGTESEYGRTTRWETVSRGPGVWRGRVRIAHDPALEEDGLLRAQRAAELSVVPMLFGFDRGRVEDAPSDRPEVQEFAVAWGVPAATGRLVGLAVVGAALGAVGFAWDARAGAALVVTLAGAGAGLGFAASRDRERKVVARAQDVRVRALERSLQLKESREDAAAGDLGGTVVAGQYRIGKRMGSGASGVIYEAVRIGDGTEVAIKLLRAAAAHDTVASDRLRRESEALGLAWHPNVVEVLDHGHIADGTSYLVMELLRGESLA